MKTLSLGNHVIVRKHIVHAHYNADSRQIVVSLTNGDTVSTAEGVADHDDWEAFGRMLEGEQQ